MQEKLLGNSAECALSSNNRRALLYWQDVLALKRFINNDVATCNPKPSGIIPLLGVGNVFRSVYASLGHWIFCRMHSDFFFFPKQGRFLARCRVYQVGKACRKNMRCASASAWFSKRVEAGLTHVASWPVCVCMQAEIHKRILSDGSFTRIFLKPGNLNPALPPADLLNVSCCAASILRMFPFL